MIAKKRDPFLIVLDEVPRAGLQVSTRLPTEWIATLLGPVYEGDGEGAELSYAAIKDGSNLVVSGTVSFRVKFACSRCAETVSRTLSPACRAVFVPKGTSGIRFGAVEIDEGGVDEVFEYESSTFSVEQPFVDSVLFALDPYPVCCEDCEGLCPRCGASLRSGRGCNCPREEPDPRWEKLALLRKNNKL